jgi:glycosyltransferase involved in cell wall biosynthesis
VCEDVALGLAARGHEVTVITAHHGSLAREEQRNGVHIRRISALRRRADRAGVFEMGAYVIAATVAGSRHISRSRPDVIHAHMGVPTGAAAYALSLRHRVPYVLTAHLGDVPGGVPQQTAGLFRILKPATRPIWRNAAAVSAVSSHTGALLEAAYGLKPRIILNGIDLSYWSPAEHPQQRTPTIVSVGRIAIQKNLVFAVQRLAAIQDAPWTYEIVGDGPERAAVETAVAAANLQGRVRFHGWTDPEQVRSILGRADVLFIPSLDEGLPMAAVQAAACGLAIVGSRIGGLADVIAHGQNGYLCPLDQPHSFEQALRALCTDPVQLACMKSGSREHATMFSLPKIIDAYEAMLMDAVRSGGSINPRRSASQHQSAPRSSL